MQQDHSYAGARLKKKKQSRRKRERNSRRRDSRKDGDGRHHHGTSASTSTALHLSDERHIRVGEYETLESIGKGGFGTVYRGLNLQTGVMVAVKRVPLTGIPPEELEGIETEITLLKGLKHPNIVKYIDAIRSDSHLNIVLEFVENGALSNLLKQLKTGHVEERLVARYTVQILEGLKYLHKQGVVHRDIKGANILTTKASVVKLADFGVATRLNDSRKSDSVVGTPYWMAPEIIEMTGTQTTACDIWSVGCTVIELITGKPPYFDLQQMPALFRIVQDDHPPLPPNISKTLEDFLMQCFQKDPIRRISAAGLLKHPWLRDVPSVPMHLEVDTPYVVKLGGLSEEDSDVDFDSDHSASARKAVKFSIRPELQNIVPKRKSTAEMLIVDAEAIHRVRRKTIAASLDDDGDDLMAALGEDVPVPVRPSSAPSDGVNAHAHAHANAPEAVGRMNSISSTLGSSGLSGLSAWAETADDDGLDELHELDDDDAFNLDGLPGSLEKTSKSAWGMNVPDVDEPWGAAASAEEPHDDDEDPWADLDMDQEFEAGDAVTEQEARMERQLLSVLMGFDPRNDEHSIIQACAKLTEMIEVDQTIMGRLMTTHSAIPIMDMLEVHNPSIIVAVLKVVNKVIGDDNRLQRAMGLVGLVPAIVKFASPRYPMNVRLEAANFVRHFAYASDFTRKMFISCGGLPVLVNFLMESYAENKVLIFNAIDCIRHVFDICKQNKNNTLRGEDIVTNPKNDFFRLFCKNGLMAPLSQALVNTNSDTEHPDAEEYTAKVADIFQMFSQGDAQVKQYMAKPAVLNNILAVLPDLKQPVLKRMVQAILSMSMDHGTLDMLETAGAIPTLVPFLGHENKSIQNTVLQIMFYLSAVKISRQEAAARCGIIPHIQRVVRANDPIKQFALPIIFRLSQASRITRKELKKYNGVVFFLELLEDSYWRTLALDSLATWIAETPHRVEFILNRTSNINKLVTVLRVTPHMAQFEKTTQFEKIVAAFERILASSRLMNRVLGRVNAFVREILMRLETHSDSNAVRIHLLKILTLIYHNREDPMKMLDEHNVEPVLEEIANDATAVMVAPLASQLLKQIRQDRQANAAADQPDAASSPVQA